MVKDRNGCRHDELGMFTSAATSSAKFGNRKSQVVSTHEPCKQTLKIAGYDSSQMSEEWAKRLIKDIKLSVRLPLNFFAEKALETQGRNQILKGIKSKQKMIEFHLWKIDNPEKVFREWNTFDDGRKERELNHRKDEIELHKKEIAERENFLERLRYKK